MSKFCVKKWEKMNFAKVNFLAAALFLIAANSASATVLTYDDIGVPNSVFPDYTHAGFVEQGYQFSGNMDVVDISATSPYSSEGPAVSGNYAALDDYSGSDVITKVGGGSFAFEDTYIKS
jgi:hypothetical protein